MKKTLPILFLFLPLLAVQAKAIREDVNMTGEKARMSYAFGMTVGGDLQDAGLELDYAAFSEGLKNAMEQSPTRMDRDEALEIVQNAFEAAMLRQAVELQAKEEVFLAGNAERAEVSTTESGLQYEVVQEGNGPKPQAGDTVLVHYEGALTDGTVFDSSFQREKPEEIPLDMVIPGWSEGIQLMSTGSRYRLYIPSNLAYGERGAGQVIPPYSTLVFTVDLLDIVTAPEDEEE
ncbi:MAG: FKBP-type peptidyl-prolyl cis-trans isomerase [Treponema sp.]|nr:FKBP-type peptidyl-prolyl cis-trans isomerase [Treponema sp.]